MMDDRRRAILFNETAPNGVKLALLRYFDGDYPHVIEVNGLEWNLVLKEAEKFTRVVQLAYRPGQHWKAREHYRASVPGDLGQEIAITLHVEPDGENDDLVFTFGDIKVTGRVGAPCALLRLLRALGDDIVTLKKASLLARREGPQGFNPKTFRNTQYGWDGKVWWEE